MNIDMFKLVARELTDLVDALHEKIERISDDVRDFWSSGQTYFRRAADNLPAAFWEHIQPSEPHQELIPWVGALRNLSVTNWVWVTYFGDEFRL